jgi:hypothetical protein
MRCMGDWSNSRSAKVTAGSLKNIWKKIIHLGIGSVPSELVKRKALFQKDKGSG